MAHGKDGPTCVTSPLPADAAFDPFFGRVYPELIKFGLRRCNNLHDAEDAAAEIMIEIRQRWFTIDNHEAYAYTALANRIGKNRKSLHVRRTALYPTDELPARSDPGRDIEDHAGTAWVSEVLGRLPPVQRAVMRLLVDGSTYREIAEELTCSEDTVRQNIRHARLKLRAQLRPAGGRLDSRPPTSTRVARGRASRQSREPR